MLVGLCSELLRTAGAFEYIRWPCSTGPDCAGVAPRLGFRESSFYREKHMIMILIMIMVMIMIMILIMIMIKIMIMITITIINSNNNNFLLTKNGNSFISNMSLIIQNYLQKVIYKNHNIFQIHISDQARIQDFDMGGEFL